MFSFGSNKNNRSMFLGSEVTAAESDMPLRLTNKGDVTAQSVVSEYGISAADGKMRVLRFHNAACSYAHSAAIDEGGRL